MNRPHLLYLSPHCEFNEAMSSDLLCESPEAGGLEGTGEEDWII